MSALPFESSRRLTGANLFFAGTGAQLEAGAADAALIARWRERVEWARAQLGWPAGEICARAHAGGVSLALAAPIDQLFLATEVNEWALCAALAAHAPQRTAELEAGLRAAAAESAAPLPSPEPPPVLAADAALARFRTLSAREARPRLRALIDAAAARDLPHTQDESILTLGSGAGGADFALDALPAPGELDLSALRAVPTALVTGSNGKTTTVRLIAAAARAQGWPAAWCCTDGVFFDGELQIGGDYAGPEGARRVLRERRAAAAVIETARGGILRRGLALSQARVGVVTNVSADHFGEYGIDDLAALADVKLSVAGVVRELLVVNADDAQLRAKAGQLPRRFPRPPPLGWFALEQAHPLLAAHRAAGGATCGVRAGRLELFHGGAAHDLGRIGDMPLSAGGCATYNVANLAAAALAAAGLGVEPAHIASVYARFGSHAADNPGRLMRFERDGVVILVDYAHNPAGLHGLLQVAARLRPPGGRLGLILGHAGNRRDSEIESLAHAAAQHAPALIVVKENEAHLRGREPGEVPRLLTAALRARGIAAQSIRQRDSELAAVECALEWARPGDVLALPVHAAPARRAVLALLGA
ncbi:MAG: Mur ligase [Gammaproteobacteria bacterium]|nr:Mur ligase [Gammaproteobacteria bacterium]